MKKETLPKGIIQGLIFNIVIFTTFVFLILNFIYPQYLLIVSKKMNLIKIQNENKKLLKEGLSFSDFKSLFFKTDGHTKEYLSNIFEDPTKDFKGIYNSKFLNNGSGSYKDFILNISNEINNENNNEDNLILKEKIEKILPYYKENSNLSGKGLTDFKFINYIEKLIHNFKLDHKGEIGVGEFKLVDKKESNNKKDIKSQLEGEIYSFKLPLNIVGKKKNIINFIYYLENVGNVYFTKDGKNIKIKELEKNKTYMNNYGKIIKNDFSNLSKYFLGKNDIFNNLIVDIEDITLKDYIDSSFDPIAYNDGETFINYLKTNQSNEKYEISLNLKFYVKGLERYKTKKYIENVLNKYNNMLKTTTLAVKFGKKNKTNLKNNSKYSLIQLQKYNSFLIGISKDVKNLSNKEKLDSDLGNIYAEAQKYKKVFDTIDKKLDIDLKNVSENIYNNYKGINKEKND